MIYKTSYDSPLGSLLLLADEKGLTGLWFEKQKHFAYGQTGFEADAAESVETCGDGSLPLLSEAERQNGWAFPPPAHQTSGQRGF